MEFNNYPEKYNEDGRLEWTTRPAQLKRGQKVEYELINIKPSPLDKTGKTLGMPEVFGIKKRDTVFVPFPDKAKKELKELGDTRDGEYINIAYAPGNRSKQISFTRIKGGVLSLTGGKADDQELYEFLETCNYNASNPNRDKEVTPLFQRINNVEKNRKIRESRKERLRAFDKAESLKTNELFRVAIGIGIKNPQKMESEVLRNSVESYAEANPLDFLAKIESPDLYIQEIAAKAKDKGIISVDMQKRAIVSSNGSTLYTWKPEKDVNWLEKFVEFVKSNEGQEFYSDLKIQMKSK